MEFWGKCVSTREILLLVSISQTQRCQISSRSDKQCARYPLSKMFEPPEKVVQSSPNSGSKCRPLTAKFRCASIKQKVCKISLVEKFCFPEKQAKVHPISPGFSPIDRLYTRFYRHSVVTLALSLVLYRKCHFCTYPLIFHQKFGDVPLVRSMSSVVQ